VLIHLDITEVKFEGQGHRSKYKASGEKGLSNCWDAEKQTWNGK